MVNLNAGGDGQHKGSMLLHEDGSILSSSGELGCSEGTAQAVMGLLTQNLLVDFNSNGQNGYVNNALEGDGPTQHRSNNNNAAAAAAGPAGSHHRSSFAKWNRVTVNFGESSYVACLSNRKIHVVKRESTDAAAAAAAIHHHQEDSRELAEQ